MSDDFLWWRDGVIYQIYPRSYLDTTGDGIGDLPGITKKLDYIKDLGVDAIWLSPVYPSPDFDFGYDVADYRAIDPKFGTMADFDHFMAEAHARGLRVVMDLVLNHTSINHEWFQESRKSRDNPYRDYYLWRDPAPDGGPPNNWKSIFFGPAWELDEATGQYYLHLFYPEQPDVNWRHPALHDALLDVFRFWCDKGVDGFRLDVFNLYYKHPDLPSNPLRFPPAFPWVTGFGWQKHLYDYDQPEMLTVLAEIREILDSYPERYAVGETFAEEAKTAAKYAAPGLLHEAFNFEFTKSPWKPARFKKAIVRNEELFGEGLWPTYVQGNHDVVRPATRYAQGQDDARLKVAAAMLLTVRGTPFIYYGDEIGQRDIPIKRKSDVLDPIGRSFWPLFKGRDGCRAPMQWDSSPQAGFTTGNTPWLPVRDDHIKRNTTAQSADPNSLLNFYKMLLKLRKMEPALQRGSLTLLETTGRVMGYRRKLDESQILVLLNLGEDASPVELDGQWETLLVNPADFEPELDSGAVSLPGYGVLVCKAV